MLLVDQLEIHNDKERTRSWDVSFYAGYDLDKFYLYSEGEATSEGLERSQNDLVYAHAVAPFWDIQAGISYDKNADASQTWGELAVAGLAPYWFETRAAVLFNSKGNVGLRLDAEYEILLTQKLILTPKIEMDFYSKNDPALQIGSGLSSVEAGLRLRYEFVREFAPYIGLNWEKSFGSTRDYRPVDDTSFLIGVRFWF
ncbi:MAG: copper resistance protein B [Sulfurovum sp.]|nr:copper resistance protein B [Sulfurovum sp.]